MVDGDDAVELILTSIEKREESIGRLRSTLKVGYWFPIDSGFGERVAL